VENEELPDTKIVPDDDTLRALLNWVGVVKIGVPAISPVDENVVVPANVVLVKVNPLGSVALVFKFPLTSVNTKSLGDNDVAIVPVREGFERVAVGIVHPDGRLFEAII